MPNDILKNEDASRWTLGEHPSNVAWNYDSYGYFRTPPPSVIDRQHYEDWTEQYDTDIELRIDARLHELKDYIKWCDKPAWSVFEATAVSFGTDPAKMEHDIHEANLFGEFFRDREDFIAEAQGNRQLPNPFSPSEFLSWASGKLSFPGALTETIAAIEEGRSPGEETLSTAKRNTAYRLILAMAMRGYGYDPLAKKQAGSIPKEISAETEALGIKVDAETIRLWLLDAAKENPIALEKHKFRPAKGKRVTRTD